MNIHESHETTTLHNLFRITFQAAFLTRIDQGIYRHDAFFQCLIFQLRQQLQCLAPANPSDVLAQDSDAGIGGDNV